ncbi:MAG TPA: thiamine-phosphate pyrophosphorylase [bacterium]|nr:thiamine-phosphate pyrophosphorylase [bacterium]
MDPQEIAGLGRAMDANANRVREGLRVMEDIARFFWDDAGIAARLKGLRHDLAAGLAQAEAALGPLVAYRDTAHDVGAQLTTEGERARGDATDLFWANAKRVQEGLRVLEECFKMAAPGQENPFKPLRYASYEVETACYSAYTRTREVPSPEMLLGGEAEQDEVAVRIPPLTSDEDLP